MITSVNAANTGLARRRPGGKGHTQSPSVRRIPKDSKARGSSRPGLSSRRRSLSCDNLPNWQGSNTSQGSRTRKKYGSSRVENHVEKAVFGFINQSSYKSTQCVKVTSKSENMTHDFKSSMGNEMYLGLRSKDKPPPAMIQHQERVPLKTSDHSSQRTKGSVLLRNHDSRHSSTASTNLDRRKSQSFGNGFPGFERRMSALVEPSETTHVTAGKPQQRHHSARRMSSAASSGDISDKGRSRSCERASGSTTSTPTIQSIHTPSGSKLKKLGQNFMKMFKNPVCSSGTEAINENSSYTDLLTHTSAISGGDRKILKMIPQFQGLSKVYLSDMNLSTLPDEFGKLKEIRILALDQNKFKNIPLPITQLTNLTTLYLNDNKIKDEFTDQVQQMSKLRYLWLQSNRMTTIPMTVLTMKSLQYLHVEQNRITALPDAVNEAQQLKGLWLSVNRLTSIPDSIKQLHRLESLHIDRNPIEYVPDGIEDMPSLKDYKLVYDSKITTELINQSIQRRKDRRNPDIIHQTSVSASGQSLAAARPSKDARRIRSPHPSGGGS